MATWSWRATRPTTTGRGTTAPRFASCLPWESRGCGTDTNGDWVNPDMTDPEVNDKFATFHLLDSKKIGALIAAGKLKGTPPKGEYDAASLTGSPPELTAFLASPEAAAARVKDPAKLRRLTQPKQ